MADNRLESVSIRGGDLENLMHVLLSALYGTEGRIYVRAKGARAQGGKFPGAAY
jgi:hypothetical protein